MFLDYFYSEIKKNKNCFDIFVYNYEITSIPWLNHDSQQDKPWNITLYYSILKED